MFVTAFYKVNRYMLSVHSAAQEINHLRKFSSGFIGPQILNLREVLACPQGPKAVLFHLISLGGPVDVYWTVIHIHVVEGFPRQ